MLTGVNPGRHGVFDFFCVNSKGGLRPISGQDVHAERIWNVLNDYGIRTVLVNVPIFFPAEPVDGAFVSGMMTPGLETEFAYPPSLRDRLRDLNYPLESIGAEGFTKVLKRARLYGDRGAIRRVLHWFDNAALVRWKLTKDLVDDTDATFVFVVFEGPDRLQHYLMDGRNDWAVLQHYRLLDGILANLVSGLEESDALLIVSDHGFCKIREILYLNAFLERRGWLKRYPYSGFQLGGRTYLMATRLLNIILEVPWLGRMLTPFLGLSYVEKIDHPVHERLVDFVKSSAYVSSYSSWGVNVRKNGKTLETIRKELMALGSGGASQPFRVHRRENVYHGPRTNQLPELVLQLSEGIILSERFHPDPAFLERRRYLLRPQDDLVLKRGDHSFNGLLMAYGSGVRPGHLTGRASIYDIFPTVLKFFGIPREPYLDGISLNDVVGSWWEA
jgi:predicted AlkP superfamily phosphohydrolase/phosphomutase